MAKWKHDKTFHTFKKQDDSVWGWVVLGLIVFVVIAAGAG